LDSGFYKVDVSQAEEFFWGRNAGCNFLKYFCDGKVSEILLILVGSPGEDDLNIEKLFYEIQHEKRFPRKHYLEDKELLPEPLYRNEKANQEILKGLHEKEQSHIVQNKSISQKERNKNMSNNFNSIEAAIPYFVTSKVNFQMNHTCSRLNQINCDNSMNFISHCSRSIYSNCNLNEMLVDCRKPTSELFFKNNIEEKGLNLSIFGEDARCVKVKSKAKRKSAICANIKCDISRKFYYILIPESFGKSLKNNKFKNKKTY
jgi:hypothetical protein